MDHKRPNELSQIYVDFFDFSHQILLTQMRQIQTEIYKILPAFNNSVGNTIAGIIQEFEERTIGAGTVTRDGLEGLLRLTLEQVLAERGM